jgi:hypothetical protein
VRIIQNTKIQNEELLIVEASGIYSYHRALKVQAAFVLNCYDILVFLNNYQPLNLH